MAQKDLCEKLLEDYNDVFSDIFNVLLFNKNLIQEDLLSSGPTESIYKADQGYFREQRRDIFKYYENKNPVLICSLGMENFSYLDKYVPVRIMGYDYSSYRRQIDKKQFPLSPVITIVLNFSSHRWNHRTSLHSIVAAPTDFLPYVSDYKIHVFDIAFLDDDVINNFTSDFKLVARFFKSRRLGNRDFLTHEKIRHVGEFLDLISVFTNDTQYRKIKKDLYKLQKKGRDVTMCYIVEEFMEKGRKEGLKLGRSQGRNLGRQESRLEVLHNMFSEGFSIETIKKLGFTDDEIQTAQNSNIISIPVK